VKLEYIFNIFLKKNSSKKVAKDRLKVVLVNDRSSSSNQVLEMLKNDIVKALKSYMDIEPEDLDIQITQLPTNDVQNEYVPVLNANIPIKSIRRFKEHYSRSE